MSSQNREKSRLHTSSAFQSISVENVDLERDQLKNIAALTKRLWQNEIRVYEEDETEQIGSVNYNDEELVWDSKRYPYHESLLPLLDIYNFVSQQQTTDDHEHFPTNVFDPKRRIPNAFEARLPGYLPCSALAAVLSLLPPYRAKDIWSGLKEALGDVPINAMHLIPVNSFLHPASSDFSFLETWHVDIAKDKSRWAREGSAYHSLDDEMIMENYQNHAKFGPCHFPLEKGERTKILLKLLKHSMSDLQRDHRLASSVVFAMIECRCFDGGTQGLDALRYFLTIIDSECIRFCDGECHENFLQRGEDEDSSDEESIGLDQNENGVARPDHFCEDWHTFMVSLRSLITYGIDDFSEKHAEVISAFVAQQFEKGGYAEIEDKHEDLVCWHEEVDINTPLDVIINLVFGLRGLITLLRSRMKMLLRNLCSYSDNDEKTSATEKELEKTSKSYYNCLSTIVYVGENAILRLPAFYQSAVLGSHIVQALLYATTDVVQVTRNNYLGESSANDDIRMDSFDRYSSSITFASNQADQRLQDAKNAFLSDCDITKIQNNEIMCQIFLAAPPDDVQDVVRGLFLRQLVNPSLARFGYGDFLVWNRLPCTPLESMIFEHEVNFPEDEESQEGLAWCFDKDLDDVIAGGRLAAQYDFTVLMLNRAWNQPWSPKSNLSFQRPYRQAITTLALCTQRYGIPSDILIGLNEFIPRSWWPDERAECWRFECQVKKLKKRLKEKDFMRRCSGLSNAKQVVKDQYKKQKKLVVCPGCSIAHGCSMKHIKCIEGHGKICKTPPCKILSIEDLGFCKQIVGETEMNKTADNDESDGDNEDESDDGSCWESIASGGGSTDGKKELIYRYFNTNAYKLQRFEEPAFANFYNETE